MTLVEIIILGYLVNITSVFLIIILGVLTSMPVNQYRKEQLVLIGLLNEKEKILRSKLRLENKSSVIQEDFIMFLPFTGIIKLLDFLSGSIVYGGSLEFLKLKLLERIEKLENKCESDNSK
jgi:hypothetical protein